MGATAEQRTTLVAEYLEWLNGVNRALDGEEAWAEDAEVTRITELGTHYTGWFKVVSLKLDFDDEGGPHTITGWFTDDGELWHGLQEFDTMLGFWKQDGKKVNEKGF